MHGCLKQPQLLLKMEKQLMDKQMKLLHCNIMDKYINS